MKARNILLQFWYFPHKSRYFTREYALIACKRDIFEKLKVESCLNTKMNLILLFKIQNICKPGIFYFNFGNLLANCKILQGNMS